MTGHGHSALDARGALGERVCILDGGLATQLEAQGEDLTSSLWSAAVLRTNPAAITRAHGAFFDAGAEVATTATYQLTPLSLSRSGFDPTELASLTTRAVACAREARDAHGSGWVVGSVGPYGASLADGSEYTGVHGLPEDPRAALRFLRQHHRPRLVALCESDVDALAVETLPSALEAQAVASELTALGATVPAWFSATPAPGGTSTRTGEPLALVSAAATAYAGTIAVGVNCCPPEDVEPALRALDPTAHGFVGVAYPNSGETWDAAGRRWLGTPTWGDDAVPAWRAAGARLLGGCCRVFPDQIGTLRHSLRD